MQRDLKFFMRDDDQPEIIKVEGLERFKDENGDVIPFEIKVLTQEEIQNIFEKYTDRRIATDKRGNPIVSNGEVAYRTNRNSDKASRRIIVEALHFPDLTNEELMNHYKCADVTDMPLKVFKRSDEYNYVARVVMEALGLGSYGLEEDEIVEEAKN